MAKFEYDGLVYETISENEVSLTDARNAKELVQLTVPQNIEHEGKKFTVTCIDSEFLYKKSPALKKVTLPESITKIGYSAFAKCSALEEINIPASVTDEMAECVFECCSSLKSINIPEGITYIGPHAFFKCKQLKTITIPSSVDCIDFCAFTDAKTINILNEEGSIKFGEDAINSDAKINYLGKREMDAAEPTEKKEKVVYVFKGVDYKKKTDLVQAVVHDYIEKHDVTTIEELKQVFDVRVKKGIPMVLSLDDALKTTNSAGEAGGNFAISEEMQIPLKKKGFLGIKTGVKVVVWKYWPERFFDSFLELAQRIGCKIEVKK